MKHEDFLRELSELAAGGAGKNFGRTRTRNEVASQPSGAAGPLPQNRGVAAARWNQPEPGAEQLRREIAVTAQKLVSRLPRISDVGHLESIALMLEETLDSLGIE